jgi:hypothetical protein
VRNSEARSQGVVELWLLAFGIGLWQGEISLRDPVSRKQLENLQCALIAVQDDSSPHR